MQPDTRQDADGKITVVLRGQPADVADALLTFAVGHAVPDGMPDDLLPDRPGSEILAFAAYARLVLLLRQAGPLPFRVRRAVHTVRAALAPLSAPCSTCGAMPGRWCLTASAHPTAAHVARRPTPRIEVT